MAFVDFVVLTTFFVFVLHVSINLKVYVVYDFTVTLFFQFY